MTQRSLSAAEPASHHATCAHVQVEQEERLRERQLLELRRLRAETEGLGTCCFAVLLSCPVSFMKS
eukprot:COSAG01_NODE_4725_length_4789_cov_23.581237_7_plen_66_part_00